MVGSINEKIEIFLSDMGGEEYCDSLLNRTGNDNNNNNNIMLERRNINHIDLAIYSAVKSQEIVFGDNNKIGKLSKVLADKIDKMVNCEQPVLNKIKGNLTPPNQRIMPYRYVIYFLYINFFTIQFNSI